MKPADFGGIFAVDSGVKSPSVFKYVSGSDRQRDTKSTQKTPISQLKGKL
jgi:hypothetical protein